MRNQDNTSLYILVVKKQQLDLNFYVQFQIQLHQYKLVIFDVIFFSQPMKLFVNVIGSHEFISQGVHVRGKTMATTSKTADKTQWLSKLSIMGKY